MGTTITYRLIVGNQVIHESLDQNALFEMQQSLTEQQRLKSKIVPVAENGAEFLLG